MPQDESSASAFGRNRYSCSRAVAPPGVLGIEPHPQSLVCGILKVLVEKKRGEPKLRLRDALRVKSAELWLEVGEPTEALLELQRLTKRAWKHPWAVRVFESATEAID